jgi:hypothetical protein
MKKTLFLTLTIILAGFFQLNAQYVTGVPHVTFTNGYTEGLTGGYDEGGSYGLWIEDGGWYVRPAADGSGVELGMLDPMVGNNNPNLPNEPIRLKWTPGPSGGWEILQGPPGMTMTYPSEIFDLESSQWIPWEPRPIIIRESMAGDIYFDSSTWVPGTIPSEEDQAWWDQKLSEFYAARPYLSNPFDDGGGSGGAFVTQAEELNVGLEFIDGQWTVKQ